MEAIAEAGDRRQQDLLTCLLAATAVREQVGIVGDQLEFLVDAVDPPLDVLLVVLHALRFVEHPDREHLRRAHHPQQFLGQPVERGSVTLDDRPDLAGDRLFPQVFPDPVEAGQVDGADADLDVGFLHDVVDFEFLLPVQRGIRTADPGRDAAGDEVQALGDLLLIVEFLLELLPLPLLGRHDRLDQQLGFDVVDRVLCHGERDEHDEMNADGDEAGPGIAWQLHMAGSIEFSWPAA